MDDKATQETPEEEVKDVEEGEEAQPQKEADVPEKVVKEEETDWRNKFESVKGKVSALEKEKNEYESAARMLRALDEAARNDPEFGRKANEKLVEQGIADPSVLEQFEKKDEKEKTATDAPDLHPAVQWAQQKQREEEESNMKFLQDFESDKPDISEGTPSEVLKRRSAIKAIADLNIGRGMNKKDAFERAYLQLLHDDKLKEEGELEGIVKSQSTSPAIGSASGQSPKASKNVTLDETEGKVASAFGLSPEEYRDWSNNSDAKFDSLK